ncbi:exported hypothetical protein [uncultured delta proteobacterium]|uniref:Uncharacterized protein n=1 Tax=uncultured delta proteobacterium TaxID=34034 RepID=A0A212K9A2_9DELT|nr:exported hypothetical protein [uncultured delta proteobacterium]
MKIIQFVTIFCFLIITALPARAAVQELGLFTADVPERWAAEQQNYGVTFTAPSGSSVHVLCQEYMFPDALLLAQRLAANFNVADRLRTLPSGQGFLFTESGDGRVWFMESGGQTVRILVHRPLKDISALLRSFKSRDPNLTKIFTILAGTPEVLGWLSFSGGEPAVSIPPPAKAPVMPDFTKYGAIEGEKGSPPPLAEKLPDGWTHKTMGLWTVAISSDGKGWGAARFFPLAKSDLNVEEGNPIVETGKEVAMRLSGRNLMAEQGFMHFETPAGDAELYQRGGNKALLCIYSDSDTFQWLMGFVSP